MKAKFKNTKGITLIALVITIIVMLILVTVTIRISQNGSLFKHAANAVQETKKSAAEENALVDGNLSDKSIERIVAEQTAKISENGVIKEIVEEEGNLYYYENGEKQFDTGLILIDGDYYYVTNSGKLARNTNYFVSNTNDLLPRGNYTFDDEGKMIIKNGIFEEEGDLYYYVNSQRQSGTGLILIDGDYYYVTSNGNGKLARGTDYYVSKTNDLLPKGVYTFDNDGKMIL